MIYQSRLTNFQLQQQLYKSQCRFVCLSVASVGRSATSFIEVLVYQSCVYYCSLNYQSSLLSLFAFQLRQQLYKSQYRSVRNKFYRSVMLLIVYLSCVYCCSLDYQNMLLSYLAFQLRQQLYKSQCLSVCLSVCRSVIDFLSF